MGRPGQSEVDCSNEILETMDMPAELVDLHRIVLNLARSREFPGGSSRHGYDFIAPLDSQGHIDPLLWKKYRNYCRVRRFWAGEEDEVGRLVHKPGGAEHARWVFGATGLVDETTDLVLLSRPKSPNAAVVAILLPEQRIDVSLGVERRNKIVPMA